MLPGRAHITDTTARGRAPMAQEHGLSTEGMQSRAASGTGLTPYQRRSITGVARMLQACLRLPHALSCPLLRPSTGPVQPSGEISSHRGRGTGYRLRKRCSGYREVPGLREPATVRSGMRTLPSHTRKNPVACPRAALNATPELLSGLLPVGASLHRPAHELAHFTTQIPLSHGHRHSVRRVFLASRFTVG